LGLMDGVEGVLAKPSGFTFLWGMHEVH